MFCVLCIYIIRAKYEEKERERDVYDAAKTKKKKVAGV